MAGAFAVGDYLAMACINWSLDPGAWEMGWRVFMVAMPLVLLFAAAIASVPVDKSSYAE